MTVAAGLCPECGRVQPTWTPAAILAAIRAWDAEHGCPPRFRDWRGASHGHPHSETVAKVFGSFLTGIREAGLTPRPGRWQNVSLCKQAVFEWAYEHGRTPRAEDWNVASREGVGHPSTSTVKRIYGTWNGFLEVCGYQPNKTHFYPETRECVYCGEPCKRSRRACEAHQHLVAADPKFARHYTFSNGTARSNLDGGSAGRAAGGAGYMNDDYQPGTVIRFRDAAGNILVGTIGGEVIDEFVIVGLGGTVGDDGELASHYVHVHVANIEGLA